MDWTGPSERIARCVEEIENIALTIPDEVAQHEATRAALAACFRDLEKFSYEPSGFQVDLRQALTERALAVAGANPRLSLALERAVDYI
ncbi:MAG: hypothetical protein JSR91_22465 [Proteobacteria bacterium]|nr:hypothetical protein [Pseudomonadota bacterium]